MSSPTFPTPTRRDFALSWPDRLVELAALGVLVACFALVMGNIGGLPDQVPMHFGLDGSPDRYGSKLELWFLLGTAVFSYLCCAVPARLVGVLYRASSQSWVAVSLRQLKLVRSLLLWLNLEAMALFAVIFGDILAVTAGRAAGINSTALWGITALMGVTTLVYVVAAVWAAYDQFIRPGRVKSGAAS